MVHNFKWHSLVITLDPDIWLQIFFKYCLNAVVIKTRWNLIPAPENADNNLHNDCTMQLFNTGFVSQTFKWEFPWPLRKPTLVGVRGYRAREYLTWRSSGYVPVTRSRPSRSRPLRPAWPACRTWSDHGHWWWCRRLVPRSVESLWSEFRRRPRPQSLAVSHQATDSLRSLTACSASHDNAVYTTHARRTSSVKIPAGLCNNNLWRLLQTSQKDLWEQNRERECQQGSALMFGFALAWTVSALMLTAHTYRPFCK